MNKRLVDGNQAAMVHDQLWEVAEPSDAEFDDPAPVVVPQHATILRRRPVLAGTVRGKQGDPATPQPFAHRIAVIPLAGDHPRGVLPGTPAASGGARFFRQPNLGRRGRVKACSQRNSAVVDHNHPLRHLAPLAFADGGPPFGAGAKLASKNDSLNFKCYRSFSSARNVRHMRSQTPRTSRSHSRRQQVDGERNSLGKSCQRAPLRRIHPDTVHRDFSAPRGSEPGGESPRRWRGGRGSKGLIFSRCAPVGKRPYRRIRLPPVALPPPRKRQLAAN